jgi:hypothetical protein
LILAGFRLTTGDSKSPASLWVDSDDPPEPQIAPWLSRSVEAAGACCLPAAPPQPDPDPDPVAPSSDVVRSYSILTRAGGLLLLLLLLLLLPLPPLLSPSITSAATVRFLDTATAARAEPLPGEAEAVVDGEVQAEAEAEEEEEEEEEEEQEALPSLCRRVCGWATSIMASSCACRCCQARVEQRRARVLPVPVGDSRSAFWPCCSAPRTLDMTASWEGKGRLSTGNGMV